MTNKLNSIVNQISQFHICGLKGGKIFRTFTDV